MINIDSLKTTNEEFDPAIRRMLERIRLRAKRRAEWLKQLWNEEGGSNNRSAITHAAVAAYLDYRDSPEAEEAWYLSEKQINQWNRELAAVETEMNADKDSRFASLKSIFKLSNREFDLLQICLAVLFDPYLTRVYAYLHDHAGRDYPSEYLAARLFGHREIGILNYESPLSKWELVTEKNAATGEPVPLSCDRLIRDWLLKQSVLDKSLVGIAKRFNAIEPLGNWPIKEIISFYNRVNDEGLPKQIRIQIAGMPGSGRRTLAAIVSSRLGFSLLAIDSDQIAENDWEQVFIRAQRQAKLDQCALAWFGENVMKRKWGQTVPFFNLQFVICEAGQNLPPVPGIIDYTVEMPELSLEERRSLWGRFIAVSRNWCQKDFDKMVAQHRVNVGEIVTISKRNVQTLEETTKLVREITRHQLGNLAQLMECPFNRNDLVVDGNLDTALDDLIFEAEKRIAFWEREEARRLFPRGRGLLCLFSGPPGTGKTMAAQVIAAELGIDLYRIDLSAVVSKYVGETSQNLERILSRSAQMDIVLVFDEADALFGKRVEIRDAHDRFANTDTSYLLQAIENYRGIAILTTNKKGHIDSAFIRRIRHVLEFPKPDAKQREQIWLNVIRELAGEKQLEALSKELKVLAADLDLTGSQIKFAVLLAVFAAMRNGKPLGMEHLLRGVNGELSKEGRSLSGREQERLLALINKP